MPRKSKAQELRELVGTMRELGVSRYENIELAPVELKMTDKEKQELEAVIEEARRLDEGDTPHDSPWLNCPLDFPADPRPRTT